MEYEIKHYYRVKYALVCARQSFLKEPPKDGFEEYAKKIIDRVYFIILNKIDELDGTRCGLASNEVALRANGLTLRRFYVILNPERR